MGGQNVGHGWGWTPMAAKGPAAVHKNEIPLENEVVNLGANP